MPKKRSSPWTVAEARAALKELTASGLSVGNFARREGLDDARLHRWRRRFAREGAGRESAAASASAPTPALIEIRPSPRRAEPVEIVLASGVTLRVAEKIDPSALARLVAALR